MRAVSRLGRRLLAAGLVLVPAMALAQEAPAPAAPPPDSVGPKALQDFSLNGTVTRQADQPVTQPPAATPRQARNEPPAAPSQPARTIRSSAAASGPAPKRVETAPTAQRNAPSAPLPEPLSSTDAAAPPISGNADASPSPASIPAAPSFAPNAQPSGVLASSHGFPILGWLLAALAAVLGGGFLFWRNRSRPAYAGSAQFDLFSAPEPSPAPPPLPRAGPRPAPSPTPAPAPKPATPATTRVVSTSLRPWIEVGFQPLRCIVEDARVTVEFDLELFNSGSAPARDVLVEARLFNAGADQDAQIAGFFANPVGVGERISLIRPLRRLTVRSQVVAPREQVLAYELAGHPVFVPLIGFNALYGWSGSEGQTSVSHLIGRDTKGEKLAPFRLDLGPHIFRNLGARLLPTGIRR